MLWLALRLPLLPLEVFPQRPPPSAAIANDRIVACDPSAAQGGVFPGMRLADAWALLPGLTVLERSAEREQRQLTALACWSGQFTSEVSLSPPAALLLEIGGSLRLFGGLEALLARVESGCLAQGHAPSIAVAPTPLAALWLAEESPGSRCLAMPALREAVAGLSLAALALPPTLQARAAAFGVRRLGDLLRLPRAGLTRRLGPEFSITLARGLGEVADPRPRFAFPDTFAESLELPARVQDAERLLFASQRLLRICCGWLAARAAGVRELTLELTLDMAHETYGAHDRRNASVLELRFAAPTRDGERMARVLREHLGQLALAAPVTALRLLAGRVEPLPGRERGLFGDAAGGEGVAVLVERLQARLGSDAVHGVAALPAHRPECASLPVPAGAGRAVPASGARPCWLFAQPEALAEIGGRPQRGGPLDLLSGPERIESGWWDGGESGSVGDVRRDYFVALSPRQEWLWIFRSAQGWFLHGLFS